LAVWQVYGPTSWRMPNIACESVDVNGFGIVVFAGPHLHLGMAFVGEIGQSLQELVVVPGAANVFRWAPSGGFDQQRVCDARHRLSNALDLDRVLPAVTH